MNLLNDSGPQGRRYKCPVEWTFSRCGICALRLRNLSHDISQHHSSVRLDLACVRSRHSGKAWVDYHDVVKGLPLHLCWRHLSLPQTHVQDPGDAVWVQWINVP